MQGNRSRDTKPELALRSALHALGLRYRVSTRPLPGLRCTADLVFRPATVAVFVDGCFWHGCPRHGRRVVTNAEYWSAKIARNQQRDQRVDDALLAAGWLPVRVWEHESVQEAALRIAYVVRDRRANVSPTRPLLEHGQGRDEVVSVGTRTQVHCAGSVESCY
ncbi:MAG TPA: very short patch repair endonuclease [Chloroflexota bacterium]|nr:very short patch repair endonuclease [Chloroflexota bacterium]